MNPVDSSWNEMKIHQVESFELESGTKAVLSKIILDSETILLF